MKKKRVRLERNEEKRDKKEERCLEENRFDENIPILSLLHRDLQNTRT